MNAVYASLICIAGALVCVVLRQTRPEMAVAAALAAGIAAILICMDDIHRAAMAVSALMDVSGLGSERSGVLLRACGIALIAEFAAQVCMDAGESALAGRIKLALRLALIVMALPLLEDVLSCGASLLRL